MTAPPAAGQRTRIAVLASGSGSNLQAILDHHDRQGDARCADVVLVVSDRAGARALERASARSIRTAVLPGAAMPDAAPLSVLLDPDQIDLVVLAGYLRLIPADVVARFHGRMLNIHPALLPAFGGPGMYGLRVHRAVLAAAATLSGPTVHFVDEEFDRGAIVAQWPVPVLPGDTPESLAARVLRVEHLLYPRAIDAVACGRIALTERGVARDASRSLPTTFTLATADDAALGAAMEGML